MLKGSELVDSFKMQFKCHTQTLITSPNGGIKNSAEVCDQDKCAKAARPNRRQSA